MTNETISILIKIAILITMLVSCIIFYSILQRIFKSSKDVGTIAKKGIDESFKRRGILSESKKKMSKLGIMYRAGDYNLNPSWYILARIAIGAIMGLILWGVSENILLFVVGLPVGFILTELYYKKKNADDNKAMMMDLYNTYANLKIQMEAGVYVIESLEYAHEVVQNERYKEALGELLINFSDKTLAMSDAVDIFKDRFDSKEIDKLCALLHNCVTYGSQASYTKDIMGEIQSIILASTMESEHDIENKAGFINLAFFAIIILITAYSVMTSFQGVNIFV